MFAIRYTFKGISFAWNLFVGILLSLIGSWILALILSGVFAILSQMFRFPLPVKFWTLEGILHIVLFFALVRSITAMSVEDDVAEWKKLQKEEKQANAKRAISATPAP